MPSDYYNRPEWSYSQMKVILDSGIDYAVAKKRGLIAQPEGQAIDLGQYIHNQVLGGDDKFIESPYDNFRSKEAQNWRDEQKEAGYIILTKEMAETAQKAISNILEHPLTSQYLLGADIKHEVELYAKTADGVDLRGKADAVVFHNDGKHPRLITDIKTTAQFDKFAKNAYWSHYDLQAATYCLLSKTNFINYYFCVVETVEPYRVQFMHASVEFLEAGERKLRRCIDKIVEFGDKEPSFLIDEVVELGDYSL